MNVPIACSLSAADASDRIAEWRLLLQSSITRLDVHEHAANLLLTQDDKALTRAVDLAEREQACCPFFEFSVRLVRGQRWLTVSVPPEGVSVLRDLVSLAPDAIRSSSAAVSGGRSPGS